VGILNGPEAESCRGVQGLPPLLPVEKFETGPPLIPFVALLRE